MLTFGLVGSSMAAVNVESGSALFSARCRACHGPEGKGNPGVAKVMKVTMRDLGSKEVQGKSDRELEQDIAKGNGKMPAVHGLSDGQLADVVAYVRTFGKRR